MGSQALLKCEIITGSQALIKCEVLKMNDTNETTDIKQTNESQDAVKTTETNETAKTTDKNGEKQEQTGQKAGLADQITKIRTKMQKRIDAEASSKNEYKQKLEESQKQIETLTQKLNAQKGD